MCRHMSPCMSSDMSPYMSRYKSRYDSRTYWQRRHPDLQITFVSYSMFNSEPILSMPVLERFPCHELMPPDRSILNRFHGLNLELSRAFFSKFENELFYQAAIARLRLHLHRLPMDVTHVAVLTSCTAGMHRSVAMAERLAKEVGTLRMVRGRRVRVGGCHHLDLADSIKSHERRGHGPYHYDA